MNDFVFLISGRAGVAAGEFGTTVRSSRNQKRLTDVGSVQMREMIGVCAPFGPNSATRQIAPIGNAKTSVPNRP
jgi:hypothetical protein